MVSPKVNADTTPSAAEDTRTIFFGGLRDITTTYSLREYCLPFGTITHCSIPMTLRGKSRGFGFVAFQDKSAVDDFMRARPHIIDFRQIDTRRSMPRSCHDLADRYLLVKRLFIDDLQDDIDESDLYAYFSRFGYITDIKCEEDDDGDGNGRCALISFDDYDPVDKVIIEKPHRINGQLLHVKKAMPGQNTFGIESSGDELHGSSSNSNTVEHLNDDGVDNQSQFSSCSQQRYDSHHPNTDDCSLLYDSTRSNQSYVVQQSEGNHALYIDNKIFENKNQQHDGVTQDGVYSMSDQLSTGDYQTSSFLSNSYDHISSNNDFSRRPFHGGGPMRRERDKNGGRLAPYSKSSSSSSHRQIIEK